MNPNVAWGQSLLSKGNENVSVLIRMDAQIQQFRFPQEHAPVWSVFPLRPTRTQPAA